MRFFIKANNLLQCNQSNLVRFSSKQFRWNLSLTSNISGSSRQFSTLDSSSIFKSFPQLSIGNVQRCMSTNSPNDGSTAQKFKSKPFYTDDSNPDEVSIYQGKYTKQILRVKLFSLTTSAMGLVAQPVLWHKGLEVGGAGLSILMCSVAGIFTFVTPLLLHFVTKKYVIDIKYNEKTDEYTCVTISFFLFRNEVRCIQLIN